MIVVMDGCMMMHVYMEKLTDEMMLDIALLTTSLLQTLSGHSCSSSCEHFS